MESNNVELADGGPLLTTVLVKPLPTGGPRENGAVLGVTSIWLRGPAVGRVPVLVCNAGSGLVSPGALGYHVVNAQPDLLIWADAVVDVVFELVVLIAGCGRTEDTTQVVTVFAGSVIVFFHRVSQVTLAVDLDAFQTD